MAVAPVNKFLTIAVPVAPGEQTVYSTPTGVSSIILYAQVSNVGVNTYPSVTFTHRRKTNKTGNSRDIRIIKESEVPPNDSLIIIDGRLVLERTALISDSIVIKGTQTGIVVNLGTTSITASTIGASGVGVLADSLGSVAANTAAYLYAAAGATNSAIIDTLSGFENITGSDVNDYIVAFLLSHLSASLAILFGRWNCNLILRSRTFVLCSQFGEIERSVDDAHCLRRNSFGDVRNHSLPKTKYAENWIR
jgi:hypothetical protein